MAQRAENRGFKRFLRAISPIPTAGTPGRALTAAGSTLVEPNGTPGGPRRTDSYHGAGSSQSATPVAILARAQEWQKKALILSEAVPELSGASALVRASMEGTTWVVKYKSGGNKDTAARIQARIDAFDKARALELVWTSGECYVAVPVDRDPTGGDTNLPEDPYSLSIEEFKPRTTPTGVDQVQGPDEKWVDLVEEHSDRPVPFFRVWRRSKRNRWHGYSPVKAAMDLLDAMYVAQLVDSATQHSRLVQAGIVFWPTNAPDVPVEPGEDPTPGSRQAMLAAFKDATDKVVELQNKGGDSAKPFVVMYDPGVGTDATKYKPEMFRIEREDAADNRATRVEVDAHRLATALELPVEAVSGVGDANRWAAWQIDVDKWKTWFKPLDKLLRDQVERNMVKAYGKAYYLVTDSSELVAKPDETDVIVKVMTLEQVTPESGIAALKDKDISKLVAQDPPIRPTASAGAGQVGARGTTAPGQPSDFGRGDTNRGGGKYRDGAAP